MNKLPERKRHVLCSNIDLIAIKAKVMVETTFDPKLKFRANEIIILADSVKEQALAMEKRLYLYKETIEGLGFKRIRTKYKR